MRELAADYAGALDAPLALMAAQAWTGGGAPAFCDDLARQRARMQGAWSQALESVALAAAFDGGTRLVPADVETPAPMPDTRGQLTGIDPGLMAELTIRLTSAGRALTGAAAELAVHLAMAGVPAAPANTVGVVGEWAEAQATVLRRRLEEFESRDRDAKLIPAQLAAYGFFGAYMPGLADEVSAWWQLLPVTDQDNLIVKAPAVTGWLDGFPSQARDAANRIVFNADYAQLERQKALLEAELRGASSGILGVPVLGSVINDVDGTAAKQAQLAYLNGILSGMDAIKAVLGQPGKGQPGLPPVYLLGFDDHELGHVILSVGNPDTANDIVTYVPGLGSGFPSTTAGDITRTTRLWAQASDYAPAGATVASIYWLDYNAPQLLLEKSINSIDTTSLGIDSAVAFTNDAKAAAPALDSFAAGLAAAHDPAFAAHTVMLGHSYGSLVVGEAAVRWPGKLADDLAFVGSPGVGVNKAAQLGVAADHVFAGEAGNDPVPDLPPLDPVEWFNDYSSHFGTDPASSQFGARDFYVDPGRSVSLTDPIGAHSQYWDIGSASLKNLARIVDAQYAAIRLVAPIPREPSR